MKIHPLLVRPLLLVMVTALLSSFNIPWPIKPQPLRQLIKNSQLIIEGEVIRDSNLLGRSENGQPFLGEHIATLRIKTLLQGKPGGDTVQVLFNPNIACPGPDKYHLHTTVIAFLNKEDGKNYYYTYALSYGVKEKPREALDIYKQRIREMLVILQVADSASQYTQTVDWLVKCAANKYTRWEGTYELTAYRPSMRFKPDSLTYRRLTMKQQRLLFKAVNKGTLNSADFVIMDFIMDTYKDKLYTLMVRRIKKMDPDLVMDHSLAFNLMHKINDIKKDDRLKKVIKEHDQLLWIDFPKNKNDTQSQRYEKIRDFIALL